MENLWTHKIKSSRVRIAEESLSLLLGNNNSTQGGNGLTNKL